MMSNDLKKFLDINANENEVELSSKDMDKIKKIFEVALDKKFIVYFDGRYVMEPYDGLEFKNEEEEFYYNNSNSYIVFQDNNNFKVRIKIKYLEEYEYNIVYKVVKLAIEYTKEHPDVSDYKMY